MADQARFTPDEIRQHLTGENPGFAAQRKLFMRLPSDPRCKLCAVPFRGVGAMALRPFGFGRSFGRSGPIASHRSSDTRVRDITMGHHASNTRFCNTLLAQRWGQGYAQVHHANPYRSLTTTLVGHRLALC